jgi:hypothetical protein
MINKVKVYHKLTMKVMVVVVSYAALALQIEDTFSVVTFNYFHFIKLLLLVSRC